MRLTEKPCEEIQRKQPCDELQEYRERILAKEWFAAGSFIIFHPGNVRLSRWKGKVLIDAAAPS